MKWFKKPVDVFSDWQDGQKAVVKSAEFQQHLDSVGADAPIVYDESRMAYYNPATQIWSDTLIEAYKNELKEG